ncbi:hypothetical protein KIPB_016173, partial [Kipferlia bialata]|eukprot:g16173.t1
MTDVEYFENVAETARFVVERLGACDVCLVLGSGLGDFADVAFGDDKLVLKYK